MPGKRTFDDLMEAVTFAEAGETEAARSAAIRVFGGDRGLERILAVSAASGFSRALVESSVALAERLGHGLVALSAPPALVGPVGRIRAWGRKGRWLSPEAFRARAAERGVQFVHAARGGDPDEAVAEVRRIFGRIAFLLIEPDLVPGARFAAVGLPIYYPTRG